MLTAYETAALNLHGTELVVLSACDSARGQLHAGESTFGLMRARRAAGARCVLGTVWPMDDTITREFVTTFYRRWVECGDAKSALQDTQRTMRAIYRLPCSGADSFWWHRSMTNEPTSGVSDSVARGRRRSFGGK